jgi:drug/metabolite transporter (DMT)-like permease
MSAIPGRTADGGASAAPETVVPAKPAENIPLGIFYMLVATVAFAVLHALSKWLVANYPVGQVMFSRSFVGLIVCSAFLLPMHGLSVFHTRKAKAHVLRGLSQSVSQTFSVLAFALMPLAGAIAINFSAPLWAALVAIIWLNERAGAARWIALIAGFMGVAIVANPGMDSLTLGAIFALANAIMLGTVTAAVRGMSGTESTGTLLIWQLTTVTAFHSLLLLFGFTWPTPGDFLLFVACGLANLAGQVFWTKALVRAPTTAVSPFFYFMLVWAMGIAYVVWDEVPTVQLLTGASIVVAAGLYLLWHEARQRAGAAKAGR